MGKLEKWNLFYGNINNSLFIVDKDTTKRFNCTKMEHTPTLVEGTEKEQAKWLEELACGLGQGYANLHPVPEFYEKYQNVQ